MVPSDVTLFTAAARKLGARNDAKNFSPVYIAGTDWYVAMSFVYDYGGKIAEFRNGRWVGTLNSPKAIQGLNALKATVGTAIESVRRQSWTSWESSSTPKARRATRWSTS